MLNWLLGPSAGTIYIYPGNAGAWRWQAYDRKGRHRFGQTPKGSLSREACRADVREHRLHRRFDIVYSQPPKR